MTCPQGLGRSISTTRGIYMGRVFIRENLQQQPPQHPLFNRKNYQFLEKNGWELSACKHVLHNHQGSGSHRAPTSLIHRQIAANINVVGSLAELQALVSRHAHQMDGANCVAAVQKTAWLLSKSDGTPDQQTAALLLSSIAAHLQPQLETLDGPVLCQVLGSYVKCRCSPPADMLQELLQMLMADGGAKLQQTNSANLSQLLLSLSRLVQPQAHWPIMKAVLEHATTLLQAQLTAAEHRQQPKPFFGSGDDGDGGASSSSSSRRSSRFDDAPVKLSSDGGVWHQAKQQAHQQAQAERQTRHKVAAANSTAMIAVLLDKSNIFSPEYLRLLYQWLEQPDALSCLYPNSVLQLWQAVKGQWAKFEARTSANAGAAVAAATASTEQAPASSSSSSSGGDAAAGGVRGPAAATAEAAVDAPLSSAQGSLGQYQQKLFGFFGREPLDALAAATLPLVGSMTEMQLGQLFNILGRMRYAPPELLAEMKAAYEALVSVRTPTNITKANAAWAAAQLQEFDPVLLLPALLAAVQHTEQQDGFLAARIMIATSQLPQEVLQRLRLLLQQEQHRLSGARGPPPSAVPDPATSAAGQLPEWVACLANSLAGRVVELRPREIAYILLSYSQIPGVPVHEKLFLAAAQHIAKHAHTFMQLDDMEMVATAFEKFNFKDGLPALKALQQQSEQLAPASA